MLKSKEIDQSFALGTFKDMPINGSTPTNKISKYGQTVATITSGESDNYLLVQLTWGTTSSSRINEILDTIQIEVGDTATPIVEHQEQLLPIDIPFNMYSGKAYKENGKWYRKVEWLKTYITSASAVGNNATGTNGQNRFIFYPATPPIHCSTNSSNEDIYSNIAIKGSPNTTYLCKPSISYDVTQNLIYIYLEETKGMTATEFKAYCEENGIYIVYKIATPKVEEITDTTLIEQLEALEKAHSYLEVTNINSYGSEAPLVLSGNALMSNDIRLSKLESALVNIGGI
jgi:hypothetical protein